MERIGFIGLGTMGNPMASHLVSAGYDLTVFDVDMSNIEPLSGEGVDAAPDAQAVGAAADVVVLSLPDPETVVTVIEQLEPGLSPGDVIIDTTTSTPGTTESIATELADQDIDVLGAPVSGGASGAQSGTLTTMVGGAAETVEDCRPIMGAYASDVIHVGDSPGYGHAMKLLNNYLSFLALLGTSEAVALGERVGLDAETMVEVFSASSGRNSATEDKFPEYVIPGTYDHGFKLGLMSKDSDLLTSFAKENDVPLLLGGVVDNLIRYARAEEGPDADMTRVYEFVAGTMDEG